MTFIVAGVQKEYPEGLTVAQLIEAEKVEMPMYVSVSINDEFIKSGEFDVTVLKENDSVEFLYFMGGGF
jgi:sulfur carrier protein